MCPIIHPAATVPTASAGLSPAAALALSFHLATAAQGDTECVGEAQASVIQANAQPHMEQREDVG